MTIAPDARLPAPIDIDAFGIAIRNLLENARLYGPPDEPIGVEVSDGVIEIRNGGPAVPPEQVGEASTEQQQAARGEQVAVDDPREPDGRDVQVGTDRGQCHVHDRVVDGDHELHQGEDGEGAPATRIATRVGAGRRAPRG